MSGHSKWSTIKRQKGAADVKRGQAFTKIANAITIAVKQGGGVSDPEQNPKLRLAVELARTSNMPKENIERAIARAKNKGEGELAEFIYEGFAPGGVAVLVEAATDNPNRTTSEVKSLFNKFGARFAEQGAVSYMFRQVGEINVIKNGKSIDDFFLNAAEAGANDIKDRGEEVVIYTDFSKIANVKQKLIEAGLTIESSEVSMRPVSEVSVSGKDKEKIINFLSALEGLDDVQKVYSNIALD